jgi:hypothetical protein
MRPPAWLARRQCLYWISLNFQIVTFVFVTTEVKIQSDLHYYFLLDFYSLPWYRIHPVKLCPWAVSLGRS